MMYNQKLVASLKANGKILREFKDTVYIPFGSEYSILLKNLNTSRAVVNIFIDGTNVVEDGLVINAGQEIDLERSILNGNLTAGNRFKFIERTSSIEEHRGVKLEDGLLRIEYQFEAVRPMPTQNWYQVNQPIVYNPNIMRSMGTDFTPNPYETVCVTAANITAEAMSHNDVGITVPGSVSDQKFQTVVMGVMEFEKHSIVFRLLGETADKVEVTKPITVNHKPKCVTCGKQNKATFKFCSTCGTSLEIFA